MGGVPGCQRRCPPSCPATLGSAVPKRDTLTSASHRDGASPWEGGMGGGVVLGPPGGAGCGVLGVGCWVLDGVLGGEILGGVQGVIPGLGTRVGSWVGVGGLECGVPGEEVQGGVLGVGSPLWAPGWGLRGEGVLGGGCRCRLLGAGSWVGVPGVGSWVLGPGGGGMCVSWMGSRVQSFGCRVLDPRWGDLGAGCWVWAPRCWILAVGSWMVSQVCVCVGGGVLGAGTRVRDPGCGVLGGVRGAVSWAQGAGSWMGCRV